MCTVTVYFNIATVNVAVHYKEEIIYNYYKTSISDTLNCCKPLDVLMIYRVKGPLFLPVKMIFFLFSMP